jgi:uncharacterized RDD family membrane protein YckC
MGRGRAQARATEGIADAIVFAVLLFVVLLILGFIFSGFGTIFTAGNSFLFALAYFVARVAYTPVAAAISARFGG